MTTFSLTSLISFSHKIVLLPGPKKSNLGLFTGGVKKSAGVMDLSKFLTPSDEEREDEPLNRSNTNVYLDQRIYDSVENLVSGAEVNQELIFKHTQPSTLPCKMIGPTCNYKKGY